MFITGGPSILLRRQNRYHLYNVTDFSAKSTRPLGSVSVSREPRQGTETGEISGVDLHDEEAVQPPLQQDSTFTRQTEVGSIYPDARSVQEANVACRHSEQRNKNFWVNSLLHEPHRCIGLREIRTAGMECVWL